MARLFVASLALFALLLTGTPAGAALPPLTGPLPELVASDTPIADPPPGVPALIGLSEGGAHIDTTRIELMAPGFDHPILLTLAPGLRGGRITGTMTLHNGTGRPLAGVRLDLTGIDEQRRGTDAEGRPAVQHRARAVESSEPLFFGDIPRGADSAPITFSYGPVIFVPETIRLELYLSVSGFRLGEIVFAADSLTVATGAGGEGLEAAPRRIRAGDLFETMGFSRCACQIDTIRAQDGAGHDLTTPPLRPGPALGGLNRLTACDVGPDGHLFVADRQFADDDSTHAPLARVSRFDGSGRFVTAFGWGGRDAVAPYAISGRLLEPEGMAALRDGRVAVRTKPGGRQRARIFIYSPLATMTKVIPPR